MELNTNPRSKLTTAYLVKYFKNKKLPYQKWEIIVDGVSNIIDNKFVIDSIVRAKPDQQRMIVDTLYELDASNQDINMFLKHLAFESNYTVKFLSSTYFLIC